MRAALCGLPRSDCPVRTAPVRWPRDVPSAYRDGPVDYHDDPVDYHDVATDRPPAGA